MTKPQVLKRARELQAAGEFKRRIVSTTPEDVRFDRTELECGHSGVVIAILIQDFGGKMDCETCIEEWLNAAAAERGEVTL
jgi:hypothetical protein